jgi:hypothetical protein
LFIGERLILCRSSMVHKVGVRKDEASLGLTSATFVFKQGLFSDVLSGLVSFYPLLFKRLDFRLTIWV